MYNFDTLVNPGTTSATNKRQFKVVLVGDPCGKTTMIKNYLLNNGEYEEKYIPTLGVEVHPMRFSSQEGTFCFIVFFFFV